MNRKLYAVNTFNKNRINAFTLAEGATHVDTFSKNRINAFTLAEVLITVGIIGVISAMTVPNVVNNYQKNAYALQIRKIYNDLTNAIELTITGDNKTSFANTKMFKNSMDSNYSAPMNVFFEDNFKVVESCDSYSVSNCFASDKYHAISGDDEYAVSCSEDSFLLANSAAICINPDTTNKVWNVQVDTNGSAGPNIGGRDMFTFVINRDGEIESSGSCTTSSNGTGCLKALMDNNWKMDY